MCLYIDKDKTEREKLKGALRTFYKVFVREEKTLLTPYFKWPIRAPYFVLHCPAYRGKEKE